MSAAPFTLPDLLALLRANHYAVVASVGPDGGPFAAVVGIAVSDDLDLVFDTLAATHKHRNLMANPRVAAVWIGPGEQTVQIEGTARLLVPAEPADADRREVYFAAFPDGRARLQWKGLVHWTIRPLTARHTSYQGGEHVTAFAWNDAGELIPPAG